MQIWVDVIVIEIHFEIVLGHSNFILVFEFAKLLAVVVFLPVWHDFIMTWNEQPVLNQVQEHFSVLASQVIL